MAIAPVIKKKKKNKPSVISRGFFHQSKNEQIVFSRKSDNLILFRLG